MTHHRDLPPAQQRLYDHVICEAAMGAPSIRALLRAKRGLEPDEDLAAVATLLADARALRHTEAGVASVRPEYLLQ